MSINVSISQQPNNIVQVVPTSCASVDVVYKNVVYVPQQGAGGTTDNFLLVEAAENINSHTPVGIMDGKAYVYDATNLQHLYAFAGFSKTSAVTGAFLQVQQYGVITLSNWGLTPNTHYVAGSLGAIFPASNNSATFSRVVGFSISANSLLINLNYDPIIINN